MRNVDASEPVKKTDGCEMYPDMASGANNDRCVLNEVEGVKGAGRVALTTETGSPDAKGRYYGGDEFTENAFLQLNTGLFTHSRRSRISPTTLPHLPRF